MAVLMSFVGSVNLRSATQRSLNEVASPSSTATMNRSLVSLNRYLDNTDDPINAQFQNPKRDDPFAQFRSRNFGPLVNSTPELEERAVQYSKMSECSNLLLGIGAVFGKHVGPDSGS